MNYYQTTLKPILYYSVTKKNVTDPFDITFSGHFIERKCSLKYLGVT